MTTAFQIPRVLRETCGGVEELSLDGQTLRAILADLKRKHPRTYSCICNETGAIRPHINIFINNSLLNGRIENDVPLESNDVVYVFQAVSGG